MHIQWKMTLTPPHSGSFKGVNIKMSLDPVVSTRL